MQLNPNTRNLKESATLKINLRLREARENGQSVYHFGFGQSPFPVLDTLVKALQVNAYQKDYLPTFGLPELREEIANFCNRNYEYDFSKDSIVIGPGSKELLFQSLFILNSPVLIPAPSWVSYGPQIQAKGGIYKTIQCSFDNGYKLKADDLSKAVKEYSRDLEKVLIINSPNNPTGAVYSNTEIQEIVEVAKKENILILSDEIYRDIDWSPEALNKERKSFYNYYPEGTFVTGGLSKAFGAGGWRLGFLGVSTHHREFFNSLAALISETFSAVSAPIQHASIEAFRPSNSVDEYFKFCREVHKVTGLYMGRRLKSMGVKVNYPEGAFYLMPSFNDFSFSLKKKYKIDTSEDFSRVLLETFSVGVLPGTDFYRPKDDLVCRIATVDYDGERVWQEREEVSALISHNENEFILKYCPNLKSGLDQIEKFLKS